MSNIDKQALREEFQFMRGIYSDPADHERQLIYIAAEALLDEMEAKDKQIAELKSGIKSANDRYENRTPTKWAYDQACLAIEKHRARANDAEKRITEQRETLLAARSHVMQCARWGDAHASGVIQAIDRAAAGKGE